MVGHRLAMGFQMVVPKDTFTYNNKDSNTNLTTQSTNDVANLNSSNSNINSNSNTSGTTNISSSNLNPHFICDLNASKSLAKSQSSSIKGY